MALDIEKCKECYYADEDGVCGKCFDKLRGLAGCGPEVEDG